MEFTMIKDGEQYVIKEDTRVVFTCDYTLEDRLLSIYLRNIYGDEAIGVYQIKKWYTRFRPALALDFTIYEGEVKMGELHKIKGGFTFDYQGVTYRLYGGVWTSKKIVLCFDREMLCTTMVYDEATSTIRFHNTTLGATMAILCVLFKDFHLMDHFSQDSFLRKYEKNQVSA